jgi:putative PIG3 family NAD(P)H quinone oxidoreductase
MYAMIIDSNHQLQWQLQTPAVCASGQVRIKIVATAVNRADLMQTQGLYPPPPEYSDIPGLECAGEIVEVGDGVENLALGDQVCALLAAGGYATEVVCSALQVLPIPEGLRLEEAAALPEVFATAWLNLYGLADLQPGEKVLLKAGGSGVGTAAIQLCKAFDNPCYVQVGTADKLQQCIELGAEGGIDRHHQSLLELQTQGPFDVVLDPVAGATLGDTLKLMNTDGRLVIIGLMGGLTAELDVARVLMKRLEILGSTLRPQPVEIKGEVMQDLYEKIWPRISDGLIKPIIDCIMPIGEVAAAHDRIQSNGSFGKVVLRVAE